MLAKIYERSCTADKEVATIMALSLFQTGLGGMSA